MPCGDLLSLLVEGSLVGQSTDVDMSLSFSGGQLPQQTLLIDFLREIHPHFFIWAEVGCVVYRE